MIFLFQSLCSSSPCNPLEKRDIIFINILHVAIERAAATISYLNIFPEAYRVMMQSHKNILLKIKNPSCDTKEVKNSVNQITLFLDILDNMESVFYQFAHIFDGLYPILSVDEKEEWVCYKNKIKDEIIKQVCHFKFILHFLNNIIDFKHTRSYEQKRFLNQFSNTIDTFLSEYIFKYDRDFLYHFFYDNFDSMLKYILNLDMHYDMFYLNIQIHIYFLILLLIHHHILYMMWGPQYEFQFLFVH